MASNLLFLLVHDFRLQEVELPRNQIKLSSLCFETGISHVFPWNKGIQLGCEGIIEAGHLRFSF